MKKTWIYVLGILTGLGLGIAVPVIAGVTLQTTVAAKGSHVELGWRRMTFTLEDIAGCDGEVDSGNCRIRIEADLSGEDGTGKALDGVNYGLGFGLAEGSALPEISFTVPPGSGITPSCPSPTRSAVLSALSTCKTQCFDVIDTFAQQCARADQ